MSSKPLMLLAASLLAIAGINSLQAAESVYRWTDENGVVHYSDQPPPDGTSGERMTLRSGALSSQREEAPVDEQDAESAPRADSSACLTAKRNLEVFQNNERVQMDLDGDGKPEELSPEQQARELDRTQKLVDLLCGSGAGQ